MVKQVKPNRYVYMKCGSVDCINPAHIRTRSRSEYMKEAARTRKEPSYVTKRNARLPTAKLDSDKAKEIREKRQEGLTLREIGAMYGVNYETVRNVVTNRSWREASPWAI
jgi:DNA invertase Pin-like site-specific DNA recombinase